MNQAATVATRGVTMLGCYLSPSATIDFRPTRFVAIEDFIDRKLELLDCYASQTAHRAYLTPDYVMTTAKYWARFGGGTMVEPLEIVRDASALVTVSERSGVER